jgi:hypothetical protein
MPAVALEVGSVAAGSLLGWPVPSVWSRRILCILLLSASLTISGHVGVTQTTYRAQASP